MSDVGIRVTIAVEEGGGGLSYSGLFVGYRLHMCGPFFSRFFNLL